MSYNASGQDSTVSRLSGLDKFLISNRKTTTLAVFIIATGALIRLVDFAFLLPHWAHYDEAKIAAKVAYLIENQTLNPDWILYPSLYLYLVAVGEVLYRTLGGWTEVPLSLSSVSIYMVGRVITYGASIIGGALTFVVASHITDDQKTGRLIGLVALAFLSLNAVHATYSHIAKADMIMVIWTMSGTLIALKLYDSQDKRGLVKYSILGGLFWGLALATHYAIWAGMPLVIAYIARLARQKAPVHDWLSPLPLLMIGVGLCVLGLIAPYSFLRIAELPDMIAYEFHNAALSSWFHYSDVAWYHKKGLYMLIPMLLFVAGLPLYILIWWGTGETVWRYRVHGIIVLSYAATYITVRALTTQTSRYQYAFMMPFLCIAAAVPVASLLRASTWARNIIGCIILVGTLAYSGLYFSSYPGALYRPHMQASEWLKHNIVSENARVDVFSLNYPLRHFPGNEKHQWPQALTNEYFENDPPEYIVLTRFDFRGFEKYHRHTMGHIRENLYALLDGKKGYDVVANFPAPYFHDNFYVALDIENEQEAIVLKRRARADNIR